jgi:hemerythrin-like domain-containing protein
MDETQDQADEMPGPIRGRFLDDHDRLEALFKELLAAFEANDNESIARLWTEFESGLLAHMEAEEAHLIPCLQRVSPVSARILTQEHGHIRTRLAELGVVVDLHSVWLDTARAFIDELRAHAKTEDRLLYQWADERLGDAEKASALRSFDGRLLRRRHPVSVSASGGSLENGFER